MKYKIHVEAVASWCLDIDADDLEEAKEKAYYLLTEKAPYEIRNVHGDMFDYLQNDREKND